jgi:hypothetical protein
MTGEEITILGSRSEVARTNSKGTYGILVLYSNPFDASLFLPPKSESEIGSRFDVAKVNLPKIFTR